MGCSYPQQVEHNSGESSHYLLQYFQFCRMKLVPYGIFVHWYLKKGVKYANMPFRSILNMKGHLLWIWCIIYCYIHSLYLKIRRDILQGFCNILCWKPVME